MKMKKYLKIWHQLRYYKFLVYLKIYDYFKSMTEGNISQELRLKKYRWNNNLFCSRNRSKRIDE